MLFVFAFIGRSTVLFVAVQRPNQRGLTVKKAVVYVRGLD